MFFFIPIGHEDARMNRFPVVSLSIVLACVIGFMATWPRCQRDEKEITETIATIMGRLATLAREEPSEASIITQAMNNAYSARSIQELLSGMDEAIKKCVAADIDEDSLRPLKEDVAKIHRTLDGQVLRQWGLVPSSPNPLAFITHMFLHGGYLHLIFNLVFFLLVGPSLEDLWGRVVYPIAYVFAGLAAALGFMIASGPVNVPMVGASGAIAGLMGAFLVVFTRTRIKFCGIIFMLFMVRFFTFTAPAWVFLPLWIGWEIFQGMLQLGGGIESGGVAHWAHVSGFIFGAAVPIVLKRLGLDEKLFPLCTAGSKGREVRFSDPSLAYLRDAEYRRGIRQREECDWDAAEASFRILADRYPDRVGPLMELVELHRQERDDLKTRTILQEALDIAVRVKDPKLLEIYEALHRDTPRLKVTPECLFRVALAFQQTGQVADALEHLRRFISQNPDHPQRARAAVCLADLFAGSMGEPQNALAVLRDAQETAEGVWKEEIAKRLEDLEAAQPPEEPVAPKAAASAPVRVPQGQAGRQERDPEVRVKPPEPMPSSSPPQGGRKTETEGQTRLLDRFLEGRTGKAKAPKPQSPASQDRRLDRMPG